MSKFPPSSSSLSGCSVLVGGSRAFVGAPAAAALVKALLSFGASLSVGCAVGADALVLSAALAVGVPAAVRVFAAFGPGGLGAWAGSSVRGCLAASAAGVSVSWWAGGPCSVPLRARLLRRSLAALSCACAAVFLLASPSSSGSLAVAAHAARLAVPVFAFCASAPASLAGLAGAWQPAVFCGLSSLPGGLSCFAWLPAQAELF